MMYFGYPINGECCCHFSCRCLFCAALSEGMVGKGMVYMRRMELYFSPYDIS